MTGFYTTKFRHYFPITTKKNFLTVQTNLGKTKKNKRKFRSTAANA